MSWTHTPAYNSTCTHSVRIRALYYDVLRITAPSSDVSSVCVSEQTPKYRSYNMYVLCYVYTRYIIVYLRATIVASCGLRHNNTSPLSPLVVNCTFVNRLMRCVPIVLSSGSRARSWESALRVVQQQHPIAAYTTWISAASNFLNWIRGKFKDLRLSYYCFCLLLKMKILNVITV